MLFAIKRAGAIVMEHLFGSIYASERQQSALFIY